MKMRTAPGVYGNEVPDFPDSVVGVSTSVAAFIGYTERAANPDDGLTLLYTPVLIHSMADYGTRFGQASAAGGAGPCPILPESLDQFFGNGGDACYVVSVGDFSDFASDLGADGLAPQRMEHGLAMLEAVQGPNLLLAPDALAMGDAGYAGFAVAMLGQAASLGDRFVLLDVPGGGDSSNATPPLIKAAIARFRAGLSVEETERSYGAAYFPYLTVTIDGAPRCLPASPAVAGLYARIDGQSGVWTAPGNQPVFNVQGPAIALTDAEQGDMNAPLDGLAVNALRAFPGRGTLVWGARTLDGNSDTYRYIAVRRTLVYIEQSVKAALAQYVFAPNNRQTWAAVTAAVSAFLNGLWQAGGLMGDSPADAFGVSCGPGLSMSAADILGDTLRVSVTVALIRPAEFVQLSFDQQMAGVG